MNARDVIALLELEPLEGEGGYYRQTWLSHPDGGASRPIGTAIYYLVTPDSWSSLHRLTHDEVFHFYLGDPCDMVIYTPGGTLESEVLGPDIGQGQHVQHVVPAYAWQGTKLAPGGEWALLGTTMAPGFTTDIFELASEVSITDVPEPAHVLLSAYLP